LPEEKGELPEGWRRVQLVLVLGPESAPEPDPEQGEKGVAWLEARVAALTEWPVEAREPDVFFENVVEQQGWARGLSPRVEKQILRGKLELQAVVRREVGLSMAEAQSEMGSSQNLGAVKVTPVLPRKHLLSVLLLKIPFRSKRLFQRPNKRQEFY
jgi:hypothetical protein